MARNILIPVDFSDVSNNAMEYVKHLARVVECNVLLFHSSKLVVVANEMVDTVYTGLFDNSQEVKHKMDQLVETFTKEGIVANRKVMVGMLADDIKQAVAEHNIDLIVSGTSGAKGLDGLFFGTNSVTIFEQVRCPVLVIPSNCNFRLIKKILYATDFQKGDTQALKQICQFANNFGSEVIVSHINTDSSSFKEENEKLDLVADVVFNEITYNNVSYNLTHSESVYEGLEKNITSLYIDVICMAKSEKSFFQKLISKSNTREMAFHTRIPLMVIHVDE